MDILLDVYMYYILCVQILVQCIASTSHFICIRQVTNLWSFNCVYILEETMDVRHIINFRSPTYLLLICEISGVRYYRQRGERGKREGEGGAA